MREREGGIGREAEAQIKIASVFFMAHPCKHFILRCVTFFLRLFFSPVQKRWSRGGGSRRQSQGGEREREIEEWKQSTNKVFFEQNYVINK